jgi:hypothetical protein
LQVNKIVDRTRRLAAGIGMEAARVVVFNSCISHELRQATAASHQNRENARTTAQLLSLFV